MGPLLHIPANEYAIVDAAVTAAQAGFAELAAATDDAISDFFESFASRLADDAVFAFIAAANSLDIDRARKRGRSTTRLELSNAMRSDMVAGLRGWRDASASRDEIVRTIEHKGWSVEARRLHLASSVLSSKADQTSSQMPAESYVAATLWCFALVPMRLGTAFGDC